MKEQAAVHIDEIVLVADFLRYREDIGGLHENDIGEDGFNTYVAYFEDFDGQYYRLTFSTGINGQEETVYNIGAFRIREKPTTVGALPLPGSGAQKG